MIKESRHINLHLPTSWNTCTTEELEHIAAAIVAAQMRVDRYHPFDWTKAKLPMVLAINGLQVVSEPAPVLGGFSAEESWLLRREQDEEPFPVTIGQLHALCERLDWINDEKSDKTIFLFPYPEIVVQGSRFKVQGSNKPLTINHKPLTVIGPPPLLDGYTWREYRWLTDWMQEYMRLANASAQMKNEKSRMKNQASLDKARNEFLAVLFKPKEDGSAVANSSFFTLNSSFFEGFSPIKWQVILFWWSSLMGQLEKKFPRVFKKQPVGKGKHPKRDTPWDFYNRVTATVQKYIGGLSAADVDSQPYSVTLQQLEMMADEAAEMEKIKHKK